MVRSGHRVEGLVAGAVAGCVGTLALEAVTYADILLTGRPESKLPQEAARRLLRQTGQAGEVAPQRVTALGQLMGYGNGIGVGAATGLFGVARLQPIPRALTLAAAAMVTGQLPAALSGLTDPAKWTPRQWLEDVLPHLAYGAAAGFTLGRIAAGRF